MKGISHMRLILLVVVSAKLLAKDFSLLAQAPQAAQAADQHPKLREIPEPDLSNAGPSIEKQIEAAQNALPRLLAQPDASPAQRGDAFGRLGQIYQAYGFDEAARAAYSNATMLAPGSYKWHYYFGYLKQRVGDESALESYELAHKLHPKDRCILLRLGNLEFANGDWDAAKSWFVKSMDPPSAAALLGLGKVALAQHDYSAALKYFKDALALEPQASSLHYQLAMTYRALGDTAQMQREMAARGDKDPTINDPLLNEIDLLKQGKVALLERASKAMNEGRYADAASAYRDMLFIDPNDAIAYRYLGVALAKSGKRAEALENYEHALQLNPNTAAVHYSMGVLFIQEGKPNAAIEHFRQASLLDPGLVAAHFQLANLLMRKGENREAARQYALVVDMAPQNAVARLMQPMALIHAGDYSQARRILEQAATAFPSDPDIANVLARLLAAAPDTALRDPQRALHMVQSLVQHQQGDSFEVGVTLAMALAAVGRFREAAYYQKALIQQLESSGESDLASRLRPNLDLYNHQKACTLPWAQDDPIFFPTPGNLEVSTANE